MIVPQARHAQEEEEELLDLCNLYASRGSDGLALLRRTIERAQGADWTRKIVLKGSVMNGHVESLRYLVDEVGVETVNALLRGDAPLHTAVTWGRLDCAGFLLSRGADYLLSNKDGDTPLQKAHIRQERLLASKAAAPEFSDRYAIGQDKISTMCDEGLELIELFEAVLAAGSWTKWARKHRGHALVKRFSPAISAGEPLLQMAVLRALVSTGRAIWHPNTFFSEQGQAEAGIVIAPRARKALSLIFRDELPELTFMHIVRFLF